MKSPDDIMSREKRILVYGVLLSIFSLFVLTGELSYMFTWKRDLSLEGNLLLADIDTQVANSSGAMGAGIGRILVRDCFGLGALALCVALVIASYNLLAGKDSDWLKMGIETLACTLACSLLFAGVSSLGEPLSWDQVWGGGLGGRCGAFLFAACTKLFGTVVAWVLVLSFAGLVSYFFLCPILKTRGKVEAGTEAVQPAPVICEPEPAFVQEPAIEPKPAFVTEPSALSDCAQNQSIDTMVEISGPEEELSTDVDEELPRLDIRSDVDRYKFPSLDILEDYADKRYTIPKDEIDRNIEKIKSTLSSFKIPLDSISASVGYTVTLYKITLGEGVRVNSVRNLEDDIAIKIGIKGVRVVMLSDAVGIEVPNDRPSVVPLKAILNSDSFRKTKGELPIAVGYTITTKAKVFDLADAPHLLVAGATKQGKSVALNAIISSLLFAKHPTELKFVFIDPKMVEFQKYSKLIRHYLALLPPLDGSDEADSAIVKDPKNAEAVLRSLCVEMDERYKLLSRSGVNKITDYNEKYSNRFLRPDEGHHFMPYLVVVVDEYADLTKSSFGTDRNLSRSIENSINRLAAKGRAAGLHVIIATQRPSVDVITGTIKGNFPTRMAFRTAQRQDSQTILGMAGAEKLIGKGDMLFFTGADAERVQCALVDTDEITRLTDSIASQVGYKQCCTQPYYLPDPGDADVSGSADGQEGGLIDMKNLDPMFEEAARLTVMNQNMSTSMLQRKLQLGFARAGRIMDQLEAAGVVGPQQGSRPREALVQDLASLQSILDAYMK